MRILIIDDCPMTRLALRTMLESAAHIVSEAEDGEKTVRSRGRVDADLVLCDMFMPGRDGIEVMRELRRGSPGIKIIAISAGACQGKMDILQMALRLGADEILYKPIGEARLLESVSRLALKPVRELAEVVR